MRATGAAVILALLASAVAGTAQSGALRGLLATAAASESAGKLAEAEAAYLGALEAAETDEEHAQVISRLGEVRRRRGDREGALSAYRRALELRGSGPWLSRCLSQLGSLAHELGQLEVARSAYERLLKDFAGSPPLVAAAALGLARLERDSGDYAGAIMRLEQVLATSTGPAAGYRARQMLVEYLMEADRWPRALEIAREAAQGSPERAELLLRAGSALLYAGQAERAEKVCREVLAEQPEHEAAGRLLYEISSERGTLEELEAELLRQAEGPEGAAALRRLAEIYSAEGDEERALTVCERLLEGSPGDPELLYRVASLATDAGHLDRAEHHLGRLLELEPEHRSAAKLLGEVYVRKGQAEKALESFKAASAYRPDDPSSALSLGRLLSRYSLYHDAIAVYERTRQELGDQTLLAYDMGRAYVGLMEYEKATRELLAALVSPGEASVHLVSYEIERLAGDEIAAESVLAVLDGWAATEGLGDEQLLAAAAAYMAAGRADRGLAVLRRLRPEAGLGILELAARQAGAGEREVAADLYEMALERELGAAERGSAARRLAQARLDQGRWREALRLLDEEAPSVAEQTEALLLRAEIELRFARDVPAARKAYEQVVAGAREGSFEAQRATWGLADCLFAAGEWVRAEVAYRALARAADETLMIAPPLPPGYPPGALLELLPVAVDRDGGRMSQAYAAFRLAEIALRKGDLEDAAGRFREVAQAHRSSRYGNDALERMAFIKANFDGQGEAEGEYRSVLALLERGEWHRAGLLLEGITAMPAEPLADDALMLLAGSRAERAEFERAADTYKKLADELPESLLAPMALLRAAQLLREPLGRIAECRGCLLRITDSYPDSAAADEARDTLELIPAAS